MYNNKNSTLEELSVSAGLEKGVLLSSLSQYCGKGYVEKIGG
jgi:hypothetical protein